MAKFALVATTLVIIYTLYSGALSAPLQTGYNAEWNWITGIYTIAVYATKLETKLERNKTDDGLFNNVCFLLLEVKPLIKMVASNDTSRLELILERNIRDGCELLKMKSGGAESIGSGDTSTCSEQDLADLYKICVVKDFLPKLQSIYNNAVEEYPNVSGVHECNWIENSFEEPQSEDIKSALNC